MKSGVNSFLFSLFILLTCSSTQVNISDEIIYKNFTSESHLKWRVTHLGGISPRYGRIFLKEARATISENQLKKLYVKIDMNSILVENFTAKHKENARSLEEHLKNEDFFNTTLYPISTFQMTKIEKGNEEYNSLLTGKLTILDVTKTISFYCNLKTTEKGIKIHSQQFDIDRTKWGISYHKEGSKGISKDSVISNKIVFEILIHLKK